jgi:hypothetical protein
MAPRLRKADKREWRTVTQDDDIVGNLAAAREMSRACYVGRDALNVTSAPFVCYGVCDDPMTEGHGAIWLVATPQVKGFIRDLLRDGPERIRWIHERGWYPQGLHNIVDTRNTTHVKWLRRIGAEVRKGTYAVIDGVPFAYFRFKPICVSPQRSSLAQD